MTDQPSEIIDLSPPLANEAVGGASGSRQLPPFPARPLPENQGRKRVLTRNDLPNNTRPNKVRTEAMADQLIEPRSFGAIIISRPFYSLNEISKYRVYTVNPSVVKSWVGSSPDETVKLSNCLIDSTLPDSDVRVLYNVNEFRVRIPPCRQQNTIRGSADLMWTEQGSGNDFIVFSDLWGAKP